MSIILQALVFFLIFLSTVLVVGIPVILASPGQWERLKNPIYGSAAAWSALVIIIGVFNSFVR
uniref:Photosystem II reaction center protein Z n=1 Tax=Bangiopsis subsimplex TaxID=139980 RepID=A0A1C9CCM4_9RHOD|nr:photosystem II protein Z [Bangiopsis subsimplex]AOM66102.1 photosystem II protein Z [Bangiopsis subsimplex]ARO90341.1 photosystem II protein Z [Bangiopsis subsimplex]